MGSKLWTVQATTRFPLCCSVHTHVMCSSYVCSAHLRMTLIRQEPKLFFTTLISLNYLNVLLNLSGTLRYTNSTKGVNLTKMSKSQNHFLYRKSTYSKCSCITGSFTSNFTVFLFQKPNRDLPSLSGLFSEVSLIRDNQGRETV